MIPGTLSRLTDIAPHEGGLFERAKLFVVPRAGSTFAWKESAPEAQIQNLARKAHKSRRALLKAEKQETAPAAHPIYCQGWIAPNNC